MNEMESYISSPKKLVPAEKLRLMVSCKFNCIDQLSHKQKSLFEHYYSLDKDGKTAYIASTNHGIKYKEVI